MDTTEQEQIELRFVGTVPEHIPIPDLNKVTAALNKLIITTIPDLSNDVTSDDLMVALTSLKQGSLCLQFTPSKPYIVLELFKLIAHDIRQGIFTRLSEKGREALREIARFTMQHPSVAEFRTSHSVDPIVILDRDFVVPGMPLLPISTTLYGTVVEAGGTKTPNAHIKTLQGQTVRCWGDEKQIKQLANRLYDRVGVKGSGVVEIETLRIRDFTIKDILNYRATSIPEALQKLADVAGRHFENVNVEEYMHALRGDDAEI